MDGSCRVGVEIGTKTPSPTSARLPSLDVGWECHMHGLLPYLRPQVIWINSTLPYTLLARNAIGNIVGKGERDNSAEFEGKK